MAIALRGSASNTGLNGANLTVTFPGGVVQGDVVIAAYAESGNFEPDHDMSVVEGGYLKVADLFADDVLEVSLGVFIKVVSGTPDASVTFVGHAFTDASVAGVVFVLSGVNGASPQDVAATTATGINSGDADPPAITTVTANSWVVAIGANTDFNGPAAPSGYSDSLLASGPFDSIPVQILIARKAIGTPTTEDPGVMAITGDDANDAWAAVTMAMREAEGPNFGAQPIGQIVM